LHDQCIYGFRIGPKFENLVRRGARGREVGCLCPNKFW